MGLLVLKLQSSKIIKIKSIKKQTRYRPLVEHNNLHLDRDLFCGCSDNDFSVQLLLLALVEFSVSEKLLLVLSKTFRLLFLLSLISLFLLTSSERAISFDRTVKLWSVRESGPFAGLGGSVIFRIFSSCLRSKKF